VTDHAWDEGMGLLEANLRDRDLTPHMKAIRGATLRAAMDHLTDEQWAVVVQRALRNEAGWFPVLGELEAYAAELPPMGTVTFVPTEDGRVRRVISPEPTVLLLPESPDTRSKEEKRADAARLLETVKAAFEERVSTLPPRPLVSTPPPPLVISKDDYPERLDELDRQKEQILAGTEVAATEGRDR
jgi:hypothetical protein